jgi:hypothetical protein
MEITPANIHKELAAGMPKEQISNWYSDLYVKRTPFSAGIIQQYKYKNMVTIFRDAIDGELWYEIPFCFDREV